MLRSVAMIACALALSSEAFGSELKLPPPSEMETVARVVWGEVRGQDDMEIAAVCHIVFNRWQRRPGAGIAKVVTTAKQFSALNPGDPNRVQLLAPELRSRRSFQRVAAICALSIKGRVEGFFDDPTDGCDHYWHGAKVPYWAGKVRRVRSIGEGSCVRLRRKTAARVVPDQIGALIRALR